MLRVLFSDFPFPLASLSVPSQKFPSSLCCSDATAALLPGPRPTPHSPSGGYSLTPSFRKAPQHCSPFPRHSSWSPLQWASSHCFMSLNLQKKHHTCAALVLSCSPRAQHLCPFCEETSCSSSHLMLATLRACGDYTRSCQLWSRAGLALKAQVGPRGEQRPALTLSTWYHAEAPPESM